ncbi:glycosyltransferase family 39 protein [Novosphingobium lentum]|uniref:glycosyltransferase family 39 protein n=1 Tax=Novosphingobium lentum TaxID=145287 RepID=UPI00082FED28|nr:glycosyltransferase family 39 protein [Novosphingobium lentum]
MMTSVALDRPASPSLFAGEIPRTALIAGFVLFLVNILTAGLQTPLWLDENFSATIAAQPDVRHLVDWCLNELSGPLYYSVLWAWEKVAGDGNLALRIPSLLFSIAAPAVLLWKGHEDRTTRILWAFTIALWGPGFGIATEARPYTLMLLLGCVQAICFLSLLRAPTTRRAAIWAGVSSLAVLTHYHAIVISGVQGIAFLLVWRQTALRTWPALLVLVPMAAWMSVHLQVVLHYANSGQTWYQVLHWEQALIVPVFFCGSLATAVALAILTPAAIHARFARAKAARAGLFPLSPEVVLIVTGLIATLIVVGMGFVRPSFSIRYLLAFVGAVSLAIPLVLREVKPTLPFASMLIVILLIGAAVPPLMKHVTAPHDDHRYDFNFEQPSDWIMAHHDARKVVLLWDNPTALLGTPEKMADVGGFFFRRAGRPVEVLIPHYALNADPYPAVLALTGARADTAVIWAFDKNVPNTSALLHAPGVLQDTARWTCRDFGAHDITVLACVPRADTHS